MKKIFLLLTAVALTTSQGFSQVKMLEKITKKGNELSISYEKYILANGLTVLLHEDHSDPIVHVDVTYHVGSAREEIGKSGFAHFFEHMMFQGSDNVGDEQHFKIVSNAGGTLNGTTNLDRTNYFETVPSNQLEKMLWLESDRMGFLLDAVTQKKFEIQRSTVKNERGQNYDNRPYGLVGEFTSKNLYPYGHPYSWLTIGYVEDLNRVNVQDLKNFFLRWYGPNNSTLTIGGDIKPAEVMRLVQKYFGSIPGGPEVSKATVSPVTLEKNRYVSLTDNYARLPMMTKTFPTVPNYHKDMAALACLAQVLGQGKNSIFYQELVKPQKALNASANSRLNELAGEFSFQLTPYPGQSLSAMDSLFYQSLSAFEKRGVTDDDINRFKGSMESQTISRLQSVSGKVSQLAAFQTFTGDANKIGWQLKLYQAVTKEDVMNAYRKYIGGKNSLTVSVLVKNHAGQAAQPDNFIIDTGSYKKPDYGYEKLKYKKSKDPFDRSKQPGNGPNPLVKLPKFWTKSLQNGIKMIGAENTEVPLVTIAIKIPGGHLAEAGDLSKAGLAVITAAMLNEDTKKYSAEQLAVELQKLGSSINVSSSFDGINFSIQTLRKNLGRTMSLLEERMLHPDFTQVAFDRIQKQSLESFKQSKSQPASIASNVFKKINYGNSVLGMSNNGTEHTVKNLTLQDVKDYYDHYLSSQKTFVVIVGDVKQPEILPHLQFLNKLPNKAIQYKSLTLPASPAKTVIYLVNVPRAAQTEFRIGATTGLLYDATGEYYRLGLVNYILGGDFNSRLNINLREDKGYTYGARSSFLADKYTGEFVFSSGIRADATDSALYEVMKELKNYAAAGIKPEELEFIKSALGQRDALLYETGSQKAGFISRILEYDLPANFIDQQNTILENITKPEIDALAKKWLDTERINILLVGDKEKILPGLQRLGYDVIELDTDGNKK